MAAVVDAALSGAAPPWSDRSVGAVEDGARGRFADCLARSRIAQVTRCVIVVCCLASLGPVAFADDTPPDVVETIGDVDVTGSDLDGSSEGDIVETIGDAGATAAPAASSSLAACATYELTQPDRYEVHGWARQVLEVGLWREPQPSGEPARTVLPYDALVARTELFVRARYSHAKWFEASLSGALRYGFFEESPASPETTFNGWNGRATRGWLDARLREAFLGFFSRRIDVRAGQQRLAWGRGEFISPNDVLNATDGRDPFVSEPELRTLPTPLLRVDVDLDFAVLQGVVAPFYVTNRFDTFGSNWAGLQPDAPLPLRGLAGMLQSFGGTSSRDSLQALLAGSGAPPSDLSEPTAGARLSMTLGKLDLNLYYHWGFDGPLLVLDDRVRTALAATDFASASYSDLRGILDLLDRGGTPMRLTYVRRHHAGLDFATVMGPVALRADAAFQSNRVFFQRDLTGATSPALQAVVALEYQTGQMDKVLLIEAMYLRLFELPRNPLLIWEQDSVGVGALLRWPLWKRLKVEMRALIGIRPITQVLQPQLALDLDDWQIALGGLWLAGEAYSFGQYFHRNREIYAKLKGAF